MNTNELKLSELRVFQGSLLETDVLLKFSILEKLYYMRCMRLTLHRTTNHVNYSLLRFAINERFMVQPSRLRVILEERLRLFLEAFIT